MTRTWDRGQCCYLQEDARGLTGGSFLKGDKVRIVDVLDGFYLAESVTGSREKIYLFPPSIADGYPTYDDGVAP